MLLDYATEVTLFLINEGNRGLRNQKVLQLK